MQINTKIISLALSSLLFVGCSSSFDGESNVSFSDTIDVLDNVVADINVSKAKVESAINANLVNTNIESNNTIISDTKSVVDTTEVDINTDDTQMNVVVNTNTNINDTQMNVDINTNTSMNNTQDDTTITNSVDSVVDSENMNSTDVMTNSDNTNTISNNTDTIVKEEIVVNTPEVMDDAKSVEKTSKTLDFIHIKNGNEDSTKIESDLKLPNTFANETIITWVSTDEDVISSKGEVTRAKQDKTVTLIATITKGDETRSKEITLTVLAKEVVAKNIKPTLTFLADIDKRNFELEELMELPFEFKASDKDGSIASTKVTINDELINATKISENLYKILWTPQSFGAFVLSVTVSDDDQESVTKLTSFSLSKKEIVEVELPDVDPVDKQLPDTDNTDNTDNVEDKVDDNSIEANTDVNGWAKVQVSPSAEYGSETIRVNAVRNWVNTGLYLKDGESASINASGEWNVRTGTLYGPDGNSKIENRGCNEGELVARIGLYYKDKAITCIGSSGTITAHQDGIVYIGATVSNDLGESYDTRVDAQGSVDVTITSTGLTVPIVDIDDIDTYDFSTITSGWVEVRSEHIIMTLPTQTVIADQSKLKASLFKVNEIYEHHAELRGAKPYKGQPIRFFPDNEDAPGWMLAGNPVRMDPRLVDKNEKSRITILGEDGVSIWGVAHEMGHDFNFVNGDWYYTQSTAGLEAWPNIFSFHAQDVLGVTRREIDCEKKFQDSQDATDKTFSDAWAGVCFLNEFQEKYGWDFYKRYYQDFNQNPGYGWEDLKTKFDKAAGENTASIFKKWKTPGSQNYNSSDVVTNTPNETSTNTDNTDLAQWDATTIYTAGDKIIYNGIEYRAAWWTKGDLPSDSAVWKKI